MTRGRATTAAMLMPTTNCKRRAAAPANSNSTGARHSSSSAADILPDLPMDETGDGQIECRLRVPSESHRLIIGKRGAVVGKLRTTHNAQITVPKKGSSSQDVLLRTADRASMRALVAEILALVGTGAGAGAGASTQGRRVRAPLLWLFAPRLTFDCCCHCVSTTYQ